jgi:hypothetical protein
MATIAAFGECLLGVVSAASFNQEWPLREVQRRLIRRALLHGRLQRDYPAYCPEALILLGVIVCLSYILAIRRTLSATCAIANGSHSIARQLFFSCGCSVSGVAALLRTRTETLPATAADIGPAPEVRVNVVEYASSVCPNDFVRMAARAIDPHILLFGRGRSAV